MQTKQKNTAVLLLSCPDRRGIVAAVSNFIYQNNGNILHADEHLDSELNLFLMRIEWDLTGFQLNLNQFKKSFQSLAKEFQMNWSIHTSTLKPKIVIFVSKEIHCLTDLLGRYKNNELNCEISAVISNHPDARDICKFYKVSFHNVSSEPQTLKLLKEYKPDLIILARYMQILSPEFVNKFPNKIINIHHSFLPAFVGTKPYHQAHSRGVKIIGATSHYVTKELDQGPIIEQDVVRISHRDSTDDLKQKGKDLERVVLARAIKLHLENRILVYSNKTVVFN